MTTKPQHFDMLSMVLPSPYLSITGAPTLHVSCLGHCWGSCISDFNSLFFVLLYEITDYDITKEGASVAYWKCVDLQSTWLRTKIKKGYPISF
jgi:hypothetical protein